MANEIIMRLAEEELFYLLRALHIETLPILSASPTIFRSLSADQQALALAIAGRALRARELVLWKDQDQRDLAPMVAGMLRVCADPRYTMLFDRCKANQPEVSRMYAFTDNLVVEQWALEPGIYQFTAYASASDLLEQLSTDLTSEPENVAASAATEPASSTLRLPKQLFDTAVATAQTNPAQARQVLSSALPTTTVDALLATITQPALAIALSLWSGLPGNTAGAATTEALTIAQGNAGFWLLRTTGIQPCHSGSLCRQCSADTA